MTSTWMAFAQELWCLAGFGLLFVPPGFVLASVLNLREFRSHSWEEKLLWSIGLSVPLTVQLCVMGGRLFSFRTVVVGLVVAAVSAMLLPRWRAAAPGPRKDNRPTYAALGLAGLLGLYLVCALTDIQLGRHLYVSTVLYDWSVRVPMVCAAMRSGVPPVNGLSALGGEAAPLRYFYFWYVVCADAARIFHVPARAALAASCVWASWALLSAFFLSLKYLLRIGRSLRTCCVVAFPVLAVMGLDLLPTIALLVSGKLHPYAEIEWWHQDRTPSFLSSALYAPHHVAAFACLLMGLLVISRLLREGSSKRRLREVLSASIVAGVCFASAAGCSILPTVVVAIVCVVWGIDLLRQRQMHIVFALLGSGLIALLLARSVLHELQAGSGAVSGGLMTLRWRNADFVHLYLERYRVVMHSRVGNWLIVEAGVLLIHVFDLGFFLFVLIDRVRRDWKRELSVWERAMWAFLIGTAIPYLFLSSASIASPNDLGVDAGLLLRLLLQLWAVPWVWARWVRWRTEGRVVSAGASWWRRAAVGLAGLCLVLGLAGEAFQVVWERIYFPLVGSQTLPKQMDVLTTDRLSERLYNVREAYRGLDRIEGDPTRSIQYNPISPMQPALTFYSTHQIAAFDPGCGTGYGGDYAACLAVMPRLLALYGNTQAGIDRARAGNVRQDGAADRVATAADAEAICRELHLSALIAESLDSAWTKRDSWVWTMTPALANDTVRVFRCPRPFDDGSIDDNDPEDW